MSSLKILIVEDNRIIARDAAEALREVGYTEIMLCHSADEVLAKIGKPNGMPDIALLDIDLGKDKKNGFDVANILNQITDIPIIFWTDHQEKYLQHASMKHARFFEKSTSKEVLIHNIELAIQQYEKSRQSMAREFIWITWRYRNQDLSSKVVLDDIIYLEADQGRVDFYTIHRPYKGISRTLSEFENSLLYPFFFRIHHKFLINTKSKSIKGFSSSSVFVEYPERMKTGTDEMGLLLEKELPISRRQQAGFRKFLEEK